MITLLCLVTILLVIASWWKHDADVFSPGKLFALVWSAAILLAELKLSALQHAWSFESWMFLSIGIGAFLLGTFAAWVLFLNHKLVPLHVIRTVVREQGIHSNRLFTAILFGTSLYFLGYGVVYVVKGFIPVFNLYGTTSRTEFQIFGFGILLHSVVFLLFFVMMYHVMPQAKPGKKLILKITAALVMITFAFLLQRYQLIMAGIMAFVFLYYTTNTIRLRNTLAYGSLLMVFFYAVSSLRIGKIVQKYVFLASKMKIHSQFAFVTEPYMYVVMNLENFARGVDRIDYHTYGFYTADFFLALIGVKHWLADYFVIDHTPYIHSGYNTYSSFWPYYRDFGVIGLAIIEFGLGLCIGIFYYKMRLNPTIQKVSAYSVMVFVILLSFLINPLSLLWFVYNIAAMAVVLKFISFRGSTPGLTQ